MAISVVISHDAVPGLCLDQETSLWVGRINLRAMSLPQGSMPSCPLRDEAVVAGSEFWHLDLAKYPQFHRRQKLGILVDRHSSGQRFLAGALEDHPSFFTVDRQLSNSQRCR